MDLTGFPSFGGLAIETFTVKQTTLQVVLSKAVKYEKACSDNQYIFILFTFDIFDFLTLEVVDLLHRVKKIMHYNVTTSRYINVVFTMVDFVIQKDLIGLIAVLPPKYQEVAILT